MGKFRKRPVVIEAIKWLGGLECFQTIKAFAGRDAVWNYNHETLSIATLEGTMVANVGDWIVKGVANEFYPCRPDIFEATYEAVEEAADD